MAAKPVEFHEEASAEYEAALGWYFERSELAASKFAVEVKHAIDLISRAAQSWPGNTHGTRKLPLHRFPFAVVYRELPQVIQVLAVAHGHRRPGYWKIRL